MFCLLPLISYKVMIDHNINIDHNIPAEALHPYHRGHGFESRSGLKFFQALISQLLKSCV